VFFKPAKSRFEGPAKARFEALSQASKIRFFADGQRARQPNSVENGSPGKNC
jgi:hypothetical protein